MNLTEALDRLSMGLQNDAIFFLPELTMLSRATDGCFRTESIRDRSQSSAIPPVPG